MPSYAQAPVEGYERHVGRNTTLRLVNNVWAGNYVSMAATSSLLADLQANSLLVATRARPEHYVRLRKAVGKGRPDIKTLLLSVEVSHGART
ncbi:hypothetical protein CYMTET_34607 [Cymbomonas tetramitiformis]|uniref:Uncharacterized protein n=1 Tax=Cymbomonas tetramitiformis TaxID=36881 RepID=A0AAE0KQ10_9CHLO|nr:hypothetical protein CYMTET_34607 [Cymbomonas tetramitiformis]